MLGSSGPWDQATEYRRHPSHDRRVTEKVGKHDQHYVDGPPPSELPDEPEVDAELPRGDLWHTWDFKSPIKRDAKAFTHISSTITTLVAMPKVRNLRLAGRYEIASNPDMTWRKNTQRYPIFVRQRRDRLSLHCRSRRDYSRRRRDLYRGLVR